MQQSRVDPKARIAWLCAVCLALLQAHLYLSGFRLTGDDVLFEYIVLSKNPLIFIAQTAAQAARIGHYILVPLLLVGAHFSNSLAFRVFYVVLWFFDIFLFSRWIAQVTRLSVSLPVFVGIVALQPMIGYNMPPMGYPLQLGIPMLIILGLRSTLSPSFGSTLIMSAGQRLLRGLGWLLYAAAVLSCEYMMVFGASVVLVEMARTIHSNEISKWRILLRRYWLDIAILVLVYLSYLLYRIDHPMRYDGATMDGLGNHRDLVVTFFMHMASGTWLAFFETDAFRGRAIVGLMLAMALCASALRFYWRNVAVRGIGDARGLVLLATLLVLCACAVTFPVVTAVKQQHWCVAEQKCAYLDSRLSLMLLVAAVVLVICAMMRCQRVFRLARTTFFLFITASAGASFAISLSQAASASSASEAWNRARMIACHAPGADESGAGEFIDPNHFIPMHSIISRDVFWHAYMGRLAREGDCLAQVPIPLGFHSNVLTPGSTVQVRVFGPGVPFLADGWSHTEPSGVWSDGPSAFIVAQIAPSAQPLRIALQLIAYEPAPGQPQEVTVSVDGSVEAHWSVVGKTPAMYTLPISAAQSRVGGRLTIRLDIANPTSPLEQHKSSDPRKLGVYLSAISAQMISVARGVP